MAFPFAPYASDGLGRRITILLGVTLMIVATALQTASSSVGMFIGARFEISHHYARIRLKPHCVIYRFLIGFGLTFAGSAAPLLITEVAFPSHRGQATSMYNSLW